MKNERLNLLSFCFFKDASCSSGTFDLSPLCPLRSEAGGVNALVYSGLCCGRALVVRCLWKVFDLSPYGFVDAVGKIREANGDRSNCIAATVQVDAF